MLVYLLFMIDIKPNIELNGEFLNLCGFRHCLSRSTHDEKCVPQMKAYYQYENKYLCQVCKVIVPSFEIFLDSHAAHSEPFTSKKKDLFSNSFFYYFFVIRY